MEDLAAGDEAGVAKEGSGSAPPDTEGTVPDAHTRRLAKSTSLGSGEQMPGLPGRFGEQLERTLEASRYIVVLPVVILLLAALGSFVYGVALFVDDIRKIVDHPFPVGKNVGYFVLLVDMFLVGATLLIAAVGFYELFVSRIGDEGRGSRMPAWLVMHDLNDLKARVASMMVLVAAVSFVDSVVAFEGGVDIIYLGGAVAVVVIALTAFLRYGARDREGTT